MDESFEAEEEPSEFETVVIKNLATMMRAKDKFKKFTKSMKYAKAFIIGDSDIKNGSESSSDDEDERVERSVTVFFLDSEQKKE